MRTFNYYYNGTPINRNNFEKAVPTNWKNEVENGTYSYGYYRAEELETI